MAKIVAPAADRNKLPILVQLRPFLNATSTTRILSIAEGTGTHADYFVREVPSVFIQPTDPSSESRDSIEAYRSDLSEADRVRLAPPAELDVRNEKQWASFGHGVWDIVTAINLLHISPEACTRALMCGAARALKPGGTLLVYGPFLVDRRPTTESNAAFDERLKAMDPCYGLRDIADVVAAADAQGLRHATSVDMPANNFLLMFTKPAKAS